MSPLSVIAVTWPFASGWMLLWGLAAAIPIIIHLLNRRRYREMAWAAMEYLLAAIRRQSRRITLKQLILLAIRVMILLMLAVALADPFWPSGSPLSSGFGAGGRTHWVLVIDGSYSMDYRQEGKSRFDAAKELAEQLVDESTQGDGFTLVLLADPPQVMVRQPAFDRADVKEEIRSLQLWHGGGNLSATLAEVEGIILAAAKKHARLADVRVCFFSDLGLTTWDAVSTPDCRSRVGRLAERSSLVLFDLGEPGRQNVAVTQLEVDESVVTLGRDVSFRAEVQNFGSSADDPRTVEFLVDGRAVFEQPLDIEPHGRATASMVHRFNAPGEHSVEVRLADDALPVDNHRWLSVPVRESIRVLCVEGKTGAARHVALALEPAKSVRPRVRVETVPESALVESRLNEFDCLFLCNVARFSSDEATVLHNYLKNGGGLVFFLGDLVQAESYNRQLGGETSKTRVLPAMLGDAVSENRYYFDPLEYRHPIVAPFRDHTQAGLLTTPVWKYFKLAPYDSTTARVALGFEGGDPAIVEEPILRGRSVVFASAASGASLDRTVDPPVPWTAIHTWPSFPPLVQEILSVGISGRSAARNVLVGDELEGLVSGTVDDFPLEVNSPGARSERVKPVIDGADSRWAYGNTGQSGMYEARLGPPVSSSQMFAVNVNTRESDLERFDPDLLPEQFRADYQAEGGSATRLPSSKSTHLFQWVLVGLLGLLLLESCVAWAFGRAAG